MFLVGWTCFIIATAMGLVLRLHALHEFRGLNAAHLLHAHSHTAFLGWIYNACFALALRFFVPASRRDGFGRLFLVTQVATVGMMVTFPLQGYARESIAFSSLHVVCQAVFAWRVLRSSESGGAARAALKWAFAFMLVSAAGPVALGPLAAAGLRGSPAYAMAIYFYLHFQYNGWFLFFLKALLFQRQWETGAVSGASAARQAVGWFAAGCVLTLALSALWMSPPRWVHVVGIAGAAAQLVGCVYLGRNLAAAGARFTERIAGALAGVAAAGFFLKHLLQFLSGWPAIVALAAQRMVVVGFLHLVFLGVVTPMALAWAAELRWLRLRGMALLGLGLLSLGALATELLLFGLGAATVFAWMPTPAAFAETIAAASVAMLVGVLLILFGFRPGRITPADAGRVCERLPDGRRSP